MAKKQKQTTNENVEVIVPNEVNATEHTSEKKSKKEKKVETVKASKSTKDKDVKNKDTKDKNSKDLKSKTKNKKERKSLKKRCSEIWSELKKVSKPSFGKVVKNTCVVITVVFVCALLLLGIDKLLELVYKLLIPNS